MMGDRDYRQVIKSTIDSISKEIESQIDTKDTKTIHLQEVVRCLRRSYYDRVDPLEPERTSFNNLVGGLLRKMQYGSKLGEYAIEDIKLKGQPDMMVDDVIIIFRTTASLPEIPLSSDVLYLMHVFGFLIRMMELLCIFQVTETNLHFLLLKRRKCLKIQLDVFVS